VRHKVIPILVLLLAVFVVAQAEQTQSERLQGLDSYIEQAMLAWKVPGLAIAVIKEDSVVFMKGYGVREVGKSALVNEHTLFAIGSTTKAMTAAAVGMLVDEGKLNWDDPVTKHITWFQLLDPWVTRELTIRDLLCHRVGVGGASLPAYTTFDRNEVLRRFRYIKPYAPFRAAYDYNNVMLTLAGQIVAAVSGMSWDEFVQERIFKPLGMTESYTNIDPLWDTASVAPCFCCDLPGRTVGIENARNGANLAMPHMPVEDGIRTIPWRKYDNIGPAGGELTSNIVDMAKWVQLQVGKGVYKGQRILSAAAIEQMHSPQMIIPSANAPIFLKQESGVHFLAYGLGWRMNDYHGWKMIWHTGGVYGFLALVGLLPEENVGLVILSNFETSKLPLVLMMRIFDAYIRGPDRDWSKQVLAKERAHREEQRAAESRLQAARVKGTKPALPLSQYAGRYIDDAYGTVTVTEEKGALVLRFPGAATGDIKHWHYDLFRLELRAPVAYPMFVTFQLDEAGKVTEMRIEGLADFSRLPDK